MDIKCLMWFMSMGFTIDHATAHISPSVAETLLDQLEKSGVRAGEGSTICTPIISGHVGLSYRLNSVLEKAGFKAVIAP